jgi:processive 1,2-diacylglycerol beta-glucosyltransferase
MSSASSLRVMILTSSTGGGHDTRAYALKDWLERAGAQVRVEHMLEDSSALTRFGVWVYNTIQKSAPGLHNIYWWIAEGFAKMQGAKLSFGRGYYLSRLTQFRPHLVISMHDCLNRGYFQEAKALLGPAVRTCTYCGEWSGGYGYSLNWVEKSADLFISRTDAAQAYATLKGMDEARSEVFCNLLPERALAAPLDEAGRSRLRAALGLSTEGFTLLLAAGAVGANNHVRLLDELAKLPGAQAIAFCGKSEGARRRIEGWRARHPDFRLFIEGYSQRVHELLQVADCVVSRGGSNTTAEALYNGCPLLFNRLGGVMPQERLTINYFIEGGGAMAFSGLGQFREIVAHLASNPAELGILKANIAAMRRDDHPADLSRRLLALAAEAAQAEGRA